MTPEQQRIAIAKACGWTDFDNLLADKIGGMRGWQGRKWHMSKKSDDCWYPLPDYLNDLNAMHEAEGVLTISQRNRYGAILHTGFNPEGMHQCYYALSATAAQRAEAFLRTIEKWK